MRRAAFVSVLAWVAISTVGCVSHRVAHPLDDAERAELLAIHGRLRALGVRVVAPLEDDWNDSREILRALDAAGLASYRSVGEPQLSDVTIEVATDRREAKGSGVLSFYAAAASTITLGAVPYFHDGGMRFPIRWSRAGAVVRNETCGFECRTVFGWIAPIVSAHDGWASGGCPADDAPERRVVWTRMGFELARSLDCYLREDEVGREGP